MEEKKKAKPAKKPQLWGVMAEFETPQELIAAAEKVRLDGYKKFDAYTPFPVHGLDDAMGIRRTILPWLVLGAGITGCLTAIGLQWFTNTYDYPFLISGKPMFSLPANIPVAFELTVLFSASTAFFGMLALNLLPEWSFPAFKSERFRRASSDRFFIIIMARDARFNEKETTEFFELMDPLSIERIED